MGKKSKLTGRPSRVRGRANAPAAANLTQIPLRMPTPLKARLDAFAASKGYSANRAVNELIDRQLIIKGFPQVEILESSDV
jgi:hypothetical protein